MIRQYLVGNVLEGIPKTEMPTHIITRTAMYFNFVLDNIKCDIQHAELQRLKFHAIWNKVISFSWSFL